MGFKLFLSSKYNKIFLALIVLYILVGLFLIFRSSFIAIDGHRYFVLFDDAMISMRYADNWLHGLGLVWNAGEHVEGFSTPLMVFLYAGSIALFGKIHASLFMQLLGLFAAAASVWLTVKITHILAEENQRKDALALAAGVLTAGFYPLLFWSIMGMENGIMTSVVLLIFYLSLKERAGTKFNLPLSLGLSSLYLFRAESALFLVLFFIFRLIRQIRSLGFKRAAFYLFLEGSIVALPAAAYQVFRLQFYGLWYPNTYLLKALGWDRILQLKNGFIFVVQFLQRFSLLILSVTVAAFVWLFDAGKTVKNKMEDLFFGNFGYLAFFVLLFATYNFYQIAVGGDPWPPYWRMIVPYVPLFFAAALLFLDFLSRRWSWRWDDTRAAICIAIFSLLIFMPFDYNYDFLHLRPYQSSNNMENTNVALTIREITAPKATLVSFWAGALPYFAERYSYDPLGKTDAYIASLPVDFSWNPGAHGMFTAPGHNKYDLNYSFKIKQPDIIVYMPVDGKICSWGAQNLQDWCKKNYDIGEYKGVKLLLKKNSPLIYWDKVKLE